MCVCMQQIKVLLLLDIRKVLVLRVFFLSCFWSLSHAHCLASYGITLSAANIKRTMMANMDSLSTNNMAFDCLVYKEWISIQWEINDSDRINDGNLLLTLYRWKKLCKDGDENISNGGQNTSIRERAQKRERESGNGEEKGEEGREKWWEH